MENKYTRGIRKQLEEAKLEHYTKFTFEDTQRIYKNIKRNVLFTKGRYRLNGKKPNYVLLKNHINGIIHTSRIQFENAIIYGESWYDPDKPWRIITFEEVEEIRNKAIKNEKVFVESKEILEKWNEVLELMKKDASKPPASIKLKFK